MRRLLVFALLFPPLAFVSAFWGLLQLMNWALGGKVTADYHDLVLLPVAYALEFVPAMICAFVDTVLATRKVRYRILWTAFAGYLCIMLQMSVALASGPIFRPYLLLFGIIGVLPGGICAWLSGNKGDL